MSRVYRWAALTVALLSALVGATGMAFAASRPSAPPPTWHDATNGYTLTYPVGWKAIDTPDHATVFQAPGLHSACQVNVDTSARAQATAVVLSQAIPAGATSIAHTRIAGVAAVMFHEAPHAVPGATASSGATTDTAVVAQANAAHGANVYTLTLRVFAGATNTTAAQCASAFSAMLGSFALPKAPGSVAAAITPNTIGNSGNAALSYANGYWNWINYHSCCVPDAGQSQPDFQCAEFVARALSAEGLVPGLSTTSTQGGGVDVWDTGPTSPQNYNYYQIPSGAVYRLLDTGTDTINGLYQYLTQNGIGQDVGDNPAQAVPGDVVFYYDGSVALANLHHVAILTVTGTTAGGTDTLMDAHNVAEHNDQYIDVGKWVNGVFVRFNRSIVHLNTTHMAIARNSDGRLEVFARGTNNAIWHSWQTTANGSWSSWQSLGGVAVSSPAVARNSDGRLWLFVIGTNHQMYELYQTCAGCGFGSTWTQIGSGTFAGDPAMNNDQDGRLNVYVRGTNNHIYTAYQLYVGFDNWSSWEDMGGSIGGNVAPAMNSDGRSWLFGRGTDGKLYEAYETCANCGYGPWSAIGTKTFTGNPTTGPDQDGRLNVFIRGTDNAIWTTWQVSVGYDNWASYVSLGGSAPGDAIYGMSPDGRAWLFARGNNGQMYESYETCANCGFGPWSALGGSWTHDPVTGRDQDGRLEVFARGNTANVYHDYQVNPGTDNWSGWNNLGGSLL